jgi:hypothetical protein
MPAKPAVNAGPKKPAPPRVDKWASGLMGNTPIPDSGGQTRNKRLDGPPAARPRSEGIGALFLRLRKTT